MKNETRLRAILALLLVVTAALFAIGTTIERSQRSHHSESSATKTAKIPSETTTSSSETTTNPPSEANGGADERAAGNAETATPSSETNGGADEKAAGAAETPAAAETHVESSEKLFGVDPESVPAMIAAIAVSLGLAAAVWWRRERLWLWFTLAFGVVFAAGDIREVIHQLNESRNTVATIAAILIAAHLAVAVLAGLILRQPQGQQSGAVSVEPST
jgi:hypothetical protein